jgi:hypothetical protein
LLACTAARTAGSPAIRALSVPALLAPKPRGVHRAPSGAPRASIAPGRFRPPHGGLTRLSVRHLVLPLIAAATVAAVAGAPALGGGAPSSGDSVEALRQQLTTERAQWKRIRHRLLIVNRRLRSENRRFRRAMKDGEVTAPNSHLRAIAACESGGNPGAISAGGLYRGKYQFDRRTWASVGGRGDPAAAPEIEQDWRAHLLYQRRGARPWPVCGA